MKIHLMTKEQILDRLQQLDELHEFTSAQQKEYDALENAFPDAEDQP